MIKRGRRIVGIVVGVALAAAAIFAAPAVFSTAAAYGPASTSTFFATGGASLLGAGAVAGSRAAAEDSMQIVRTIERGEKVTNLVNEMKGLAWSTGNEHAVVSLINGTRALVSGGPTRISNMEGVRRILGHIHPPGMGTAGPSGADIGALLELKQRSSYLIEKGQLYKFFAR